MQIKIIWSITIKLSIKQNTFLSLPKNNITTEVLNELKLTSDLNLQK